MQAYATAEMASAAELRLLDRRAAIPSRTSDSSGSGNAVLDDVLGQLAELVAERVAARLMAPRANREDDWLDTRRAAEYLGIHRDRLRRLAAEGAIAAEQSGAGCKLFFRRSTLDAWRCPGSTWVVQIGDRRHG